LITAVLTATITQADHSVLITRADHHDAPRIVQLDGPGRVVVRVKSIKPGSGQPQATLR
jgi:hypothetical protein